MWLHDVHFSFGLVNPTSIDNLGKYTYSGYSIVFNSQSFFFFFFFFSVFVFLDVNCVKIY